MAKDAKTQWHLSDQFKAHTVSKCHIVCTRHIPADGPVVCSHCRTLLSQGLTAVLPATGGTHILVDRGEASCWAQGHRRDEDRAAPQGPQAHGSNACALHQVSP